MRFRAFVVGAGVLVLLFSAVFSEAGPVLVTQVGAQGHDPSGRLTGHVAPFHNSFRSLSVGDADDHITLAAALNGRGGSHFELNSAAFRSAWNLGRAVSDELGGDAAELSALGRRDEVLTSLLESGKGNEDGLEQALSAPYALKNENENGNATGNGNGNNGNGNGNGNSGGNGNGHEESNGNGHCQSQGNGHDNDVCEASPIAVPEPGSLLLFSFGIAGLCASRRRREPRHQDPRRIRQ